MSDTLSTWDTKSLLSKLQDAGMPVIEDGAVKVLNAVFDWIQDSVGKSENKYDDLIMTILPFMRTYALKLADKIADVDSPAIKKAIEDAEGAGKSESVAANPVASLPMA